MIASAEGRAVPGARVSLVPLDQEHHGDLPLCPCLPFPECTIGLGCCAACPAAFGVLLADAQSHHTFTALAQASTGPDGVACFAPPDAGSLAVWAEAGGFAPGTSEVKGSSVAIELERPQRFGYRVTNADGGALPCGRVLAFSLAPYRVFAGWREGDETWFEGLPRQHGIAAWCEAPGYDTLVNGVNRVLDDPPEQVTDLALQQGARVEGVVTEDGIPAAGALVTLSTEILRQKTTTDSAGRFRFWPSWIRGAELHASRDGAIDEAYLGESDERPAEDGPFSSARVELKLVRSARVEGVLLDSNHQPIVGQTVLALVPNYSKGTSIGQDIEAEGATDERGRFAIGGLLPGRHALVVFLHGNSERVPDQVVQLSAGEVLTVELGARPVAPGR